MRRILEACCLLCLVATAARGQAPQRLSLDSVKASQRGLLDPTKVPHPRPHFEPEYTFDTPTDPGTFSRGQQMSHAAAMRFPQRRRHDLLIEALSQQFLTPIAEH